MAIGRDYGDQDRATAGFAGIDQMNLRAEHERQLNRPIPQAFADYIQRLMKGEDPVALGREAAMHPEVKGMIAGGGQGGGMPRPQDSLSQVGPGAGPGYPALYAPGGVNPAHGPSGPLPSFIPGQGPQGSNPINGAAVGPTAGDNSRPGMGYNLPPPASPWDTQYGLPPLNNVVQNGVTMNRPGPSPAMQGHSMANSAIRPGQLPGDRVNSMQSLANMAAMPTPHPMTGMPQAQVMQPPQQPGGGPLVPRMNFPAPQFQGGDTMSYRELNAIQPNLPTMIASQAKVQQASAANDTRLAQTDMRGKVALAVQGMKSKGISDGQIVQMLLGTAKEEGLQERFVEGEKGKTERAKIGADATKSAAGIRSGSQPNEDRKDIRSLERDIAGIVSKPDWTKDAQSVADVNRKMKELEAARARQGIGPSAKTDSPMPIKTGPKDQKITRKVYKPSLNQTQWLNAAGEVVKSKPGRVTTE